MSHENLVLCLKKKKRERENALQKKREKEKKKEGKKKKIYFLSLKERHSSSRGKWDMKEYEINQF